MYRERVNEKLPTEYLLHEFDELISCKSLGSYNCCEMVSIYLCQREKEMPDNVYTIFVFETRPNVEKSSERLLKKLKSITDTYSLGIQRKVLDVSEVRSIFELLCNSRDKKEVDIGDGRLETGYLEGVSKVFIQQDSTKEMLLNKVLKNNFINGSYILEFFDCDKKIVNVLNTVQFRKMTDTIFDAIPIDLFSVSDRIGNFVFQFPSTNVRVSYKKDDMERQLTYDVSFDKECESDDQFLVLSEGVFDDSIISFGTRTFKQEGCNTTFEVGDASRFCRTTIIDVKRQLILSRQETSFIRRMTYPFLEFDYVHGKADLRNDIQSTNMVLGIDEYLEGDARDKDLEFIEFKKFFQRIHKETGGLYEGWLEEIQSEKKIYEISAIVKENGIVKKHHRVVKYHKVFIFGHSLDITDKDILRKFILNENVKIIIFYTDKEDYKKKIINLIKIIGQDELVKRTGGKNKTIVFQKINTCTLESDSMREK